ALFVGEGEFWWLHRSRLNGEGGGPAAAMDICSAKEEKYRGWQGEREKKREVAAVGFPAASEERRATGGVFGCWSRYGGSLEMRVKRRGVRGGAGLFR
ncbi:hypothetical protein HAX54_028988, partial [Datura stramonium]|nr:hypothetical protein [Datura stramonium]